MENWCWNIRKIKKTGQGLPEELGKYIWLAKAGTSQEAPASKSGSSSPIGALIDGTKVTLSGFAYNLLFVTLGNIVGGSFIGFAYYIIGKKKK